jgi:hypothetical protein
VGAGLPQPEQIMARLEETAVKDLFSDWKASKKRCYWREDA